MILNPFISLFFLFISFFFYSVSMFGIICDENYGSFKFGGCFSHKNV